METVFLIHNTPEWLRFRKSGIGGSDASAILGCNPYKSAMELWEEKTGRKEPKKVSSAGAVQYGKDAEAPLVNLFKLDFPQYRVTTRKDIVYREGCMFASLDGVITDSKNRNGVLEVKTAEIFASMHKERWNGQIPQNYYIQILHYLAVTGWDFAILKAQLKSKDRDGETYLQTKHYTVERESVKSDIEYLVTKEREFWRCVETDTRPSSILLPQL